MERFRYLGNTIRTRGGVFDSVITRIRGCKFRDLVPPLARRGLPIVAKDRFYFALVGSVMLYGSRNWPVKEGDLIWLERNNARIVRGMLGVRPEDRIYVEESRARLKLESLGECLQGERLQWFGHLERMEDSGFSSKCRTFKISGSFPRRWPRKTWNEVVRVDLKERKFMDIAKDINAWKSFIRNHPSFASVGNSC